MRQKLALALVAALLLLAADSLYPQSQFHEYERLIADLANHRQPPPGTEFIFARVRFTSHGPGRGPRGDHRIPGWAHDYPDAEEHILQIASEATGINLTRDSYVIVDLASDDLFRYPFAYFSEVGEMTLSEKEAANLREYLNRGGFGLADDLDEQSFRWFEREMRKVFPERGFVQLTLEQAVFHTFYDIPTLDVSPPYEQTGPTRFMGYFDDRGRLCFVVNANHDMGDYWEWIDQPQYPLPPSTEALRFGINYLIFALTH
ncbi:MAG TPA: DUF4159 domain-containing protein [Terriglobia bacterium]|nr:DUF4159 domain-containing protein [Terriglobia bacterium]